MIRFILGLVIIMGAAGGLEKDTIDISQMLLWSTLGLLLMGWAASSLNKEEEEDIV